MVTLTKEGPSIHPDPRISGLCARKKCLYIIDHNANAQCEHYNYLDSLCANRQILILDWNYLEQEFRIDSSKILECVDKCLLRIKKE